VDTGKYCIGGPEHAPHVACQLRLQPAERVDVDVPVTAGEYLLRATRLTNQQFVRVRSQAAPSRLDVSLSKLGNAQSNIRAGRVSLSIYNDLSTQQLVRLERIVARRNVVTASAASSLQRFRELFPHQVFRRDVPMVSEDVTLLAVSLTGLDPLYEQLGESEAYVILQRAMADLEKQIVSNSGAVVRTNGEYLLAAFARSADAVKSGLDMLKWIAQDSVLREAWLNIVVHRGQTLVTTQNGRLDYFGAIPRRANELLNLANGRMIVTDAVFSDDVVQKLVNSDGVAIQVGSYQLKDGTRILAQNVSLTQ
jgi:class 3 adenylate cyclase